MIIVYQVNDVINKQANMQEGHENDNCKYPKEMPEKFFRKCLVIICMREKVEKITKHDGHINNSHNNWKY
jgi:hypothetical protein